MFARVSIFILAVFMFFNICGCREDPLIEQLRRENPFRKPEKEKQTTKKWLNVSCDTLKLELPATFDIHQLMIFQKYRLTGQNERYINPAVLEGFGSVKLWQENGFVVSVAPRSLWGKTLQELDVFFTDIAPQSTLRIFRDRDECADLYLREITDSESIFVFDPGMNPHGYTLSNGESIFRVVCQPPKFSSTEPSSVYISTAMMFKESVPYTSNSVVDLYQKAQPEQIISFDYLTLSGMLVNDHVIIITCDDESINDSSAAGRLLFNSETNNRVFAVFAPNAKMTESYY